MPVRDAVQGFRQAICVTVRGPARARAARAPPGSPDQAMITGRPPGGLDAPLAYDGGFGGRAGRESVQEAPESRVNQGAEP